MKPLARAVFGVGAFLPPIGVVSLAVYLTAVFPMPRGGLPSYRSLSLIPTSTWMTVGGGIVAVALVQILLGIVVAVHVSQRKDLSAAEKAGWTMACLFVGSIALPLFFFRKIRGRDDSGIGGS